MTGIIFDTIEGFNTLDKAVNDFQKANVQNYNSPRWMMPIYGQDGKILALPNPSKTNYDFSDYTFVNVEWTDTNWFPNTEI